LPKALRQQVAEFLSAHPGFICSECLASNLGLPGPYVAMTTIGLAQLGQFETASYQACSRCGALTRVIREHAASLK
jgi:hypothetical protein